MSRSRSKLLPIGSNMNDAAYPFRGEHKLEDVINHGHSGVGKHARTSLALKISGSNLVIEQLHAPKGSALNCELAVDGSVPRAVALGGVGEASGTAAALAVPGDGRDYHVTAVVKTDRGKHFCKMTFNGSEGQRVVRLRAPTQGPPDAMQLFVDGKRVKPIGGWFSIPVRAADCALVLAVPDAGVPPHSSWRPFSSPSPSFGEFKDQRDAALPSIVDHSGAAQGASHFVLESVPGTSATAVLQCGATGQRFSLAENTATAVPASAGPYRLHLPRTAPPALPSVQGVGQGTSAPTPAAARGPATDGGEKASAVPPVEVAKSGGAAAGEPLPENHPPLELECRPHAGANGSHCYTVIATCPGTATPFNVHLKAKNGAVASGLGHATLTLPHRREQQVQVTITSASSSSSSGGGVSAQNPSTVLLRQRQYVPCLQPPAVGLSVQEEPNTGALLIRGVDGSRVTVAPLGGVASASQAVPVPGVASNVGRVDRTKGPQTVTVEQANPDGSVSAATMSIDGKAAPPSSLPSPAPLALPIPSLGGPPGVSPAGASHGAGANEPSEAALLAQWANALAAALQGASLEEARRAVSGVSTPPTAAASTITDYVREQLMRQTPNFTFSTRPGGLSGVACAGSEVKAAIGGEAETVVPPGAAVNIPGGEFATLTARQPGSGRPVASLQVVNGAAHLDAPSPAGPASVAGQGNRDGAEEAMMARVVECLQRHNLDPAKVAEELSSFPTTSLSPGGQRLVPLLVNCLRRVSVGPASTAAASSASSPADDIFFTCGNGYIANIYTSQPHYQITASIDGQPAVPVQQRGRLPVGGADVKFSTDGQPHFVELVAKDPLSGQVKKQTRLTVMGCEEVAPPRSSSAPAPLSPQSASALGQPPTPRRESAPGMVTPTQREAPTGAASAAPASTGGGGKVPYLDLSLQESGQEMRLRCVTRTGHRIVCEVDGLGGDTGLSDFTARLHSSRPHRVELSVVDAFGQVALQQRLDVPALGSSVWGVALQEGGLSLDPDGTSMATVAIDRAPERAVQGNYLSLDTNVPHYLVFRRYLNGIHGVKAGELALRTPSFISPADLEVLIRLYRNHVATGGADDGGLRQELQMLRNRSTTPTVRDLIDALVQALGLPRGVPSGGAPRFHVASADTGGGTSGQVYFRLTGRD